MTIRISVVVPVFNKEKFVRRALRSALGQSRPADEIILVDDGSTDASLAVIADLLGDGVRVVRQDNAGPGAARNRGVAEAGSDWIAFLDADDLWFDDHLAILAELIETVPTADLVSTAFERSSDGTTARPRAACATPGYPLNFFREHARREAVWTSSVGVRREAFLETSGFGPTVPGEDTEFWARFALDHPMACTRRVTALYMVETGGLMDKYRDGDPAKRELISGPVFPTLDAALADPRYQAMHGDIQGFRDALIRRRAKHALFTGDPRRARAALALLPAPGRGYRLLATLPGPVLRIGIGVSSRLKRYTRRFTSRLAVR